MQCQKRREQTEGERAKTTTCLQLLSLATSPGDANDRRISGIVEDFTGQHQSEQASAAPGQADRPATVPYVSIITGCPA